MDAAGDGSEIFELCGWEARPTRVAIIRHVKTGKNFGLVMGCDLGDKHNQREVIKFLENHNVLLVAMASGWLLMAALLDFSLALTSKSIMTLGSGIILRTGNTNDFVVMWH